MSLWANIRIISEAVGYSVRGANAILVPAVDDVVRSYEKLNLDTQHFFREGSETDLLKIIEYFKYRALVLNNYVKPRLMDKNKAEAVFLCLEQSLHPNCPLPMNKQRGEKKAHAYLTGIVNMLIEAHIGNMPCDYDPRRLITITKDNTLLRALSRRVDGAFPSTINPVVVWEIKEYYNTTSFGSRVADGVYETLLDGMELQELKQSEGIDVSHYLMIDAYNNWWNLGKSYLCRMVDMIHMGYVDEVLFGYEVYEQLPDIVKGWVIEANARTMRAQ